MANASTAEGTLTLHGPAISVHAFLHFTGRIRNWYYNIDINDETEEIEQLQKLITKDPSEEVTIELPFTAVGRWYFSANVKQFFNWLNHDRKSRESDQWQEDWTIEDEKHWQELNFNPIEITFDYIDLEEGNGVFVDEKASLTWSKETLPETTFFETTKEQYALTAENLQNLLHYENVFDYSSYAVNDLDQNEDIDWVEYIKEHVTPTFDTTIFSNKESDKHKEFIEKLGAELDSNRQQEGMNAIWYSIIEWFEDDLVQKAIKTVLK